MSRYVVSLLGIALLCSLVLAQDEKQNVEGKVKTRYDINGNPINQGLNAKGLHRVVGSTKLVSGLSLITLNTSTANGQQDVSFTDSTTYGGKAWSAALANRAKRYSILPVSGKQFYVVSSDNTDTVTVRFEVEGE